MELSYWGCLIYEILVVFLSQSPEFSAKKPNKTPVKQNGPAGKPSGSAVKPQIKVGKAALFTCSYFINLGTAIREGQLLGSTIR